jgi:hypothetical protein
VEKAKSVDFFITGRMSEFDSDKVVFFKKRTNKKGIRHSENSLCLAAIKLLPQQPV